MWTDKSLYILIIMLQCTFVFAFDSGLKVLTSALPSQSRSRSQTSA